MIPHDPRLNPLQLYSPFITHFPSCISAGQALVWPSHIGPGRRLTDFGTLPFFAALRHARMTRCLQACMHAWQRARPEACQCFALACRCIRRTTARAPLWILWRGLLTRCARASTRTAKPSSTGCSRRSRRCVHSLQPITFVKMHDFGRRVRVPAWSHEVCIHQCSPLFVVVVSVSFHGRQLLAVLRSLCRISTIIRRMRAAGSGRRRNHVQAEVYSCFMSVSAGVAGAAGRADLGLLPPVAGQHGAEQAQADLVRGGREGRWLGRPANAYRAGDYLLFSPLVFSFSFMSSPLGSRICGSC